MIRVFALASLVAFGCALALPLVSSDAAAQGVPRNSNCQTSGDAAKGYKC